MAKVKVEEVAKTNENKLSEVKKSNRPGLGKDKVISVDTKDADMLKWDHEGYNLRFLDTDAAFKTISPEVQKRLSPESFGSYSIVSAIRAGIDVGMLQKDYDVMPGSANDRLRVSGKKDGMDYYYARPDSVGMEQQKGWRVCTDPDIKTSGRNSGSLHTVGGDRNPELVLMDIPTEVNKTHKKQKVEKRKQMTERNKNAFKENIAQLGGKGIDASF